MLKAIHAMHFQARTNNLTNILEQYGSIAGEK
jgi:hypothetical protein